jgi:hypothetical protein
VTDQVSHPYKTRTKRSGLVCENRKNLSKVAEPCAALSCCRRFNRFTLLLTWIRKCLMLWYPTAHQYNHKSPLLKHILDEFNNQKPRQDSHGNN